MKRHRWSIVILIAIGVVVNYFDRINMSVAMPLLQKEFNLTAGQMGIFYLPLHGRTPFFNFLWDLYWTK